MVKKVCRFDVHQKHFFSWKIGISKFNKLGETFDMSAKLLRFDSICRSQMLLLLLLIHHQLYKTHQYLETNVFLGKNRTANADTTKDKYS